MFKSAENSDVNAIKAIRVVRKLGNKNAYEFADLWKGFAAGNARQGKKEVVMGDRLSGSIITAAVAAVALLSQHPSHKLLLSSRSFRLGTENILG